MSARTCCKRGAEIGGWIVPGATLALLPKCPACIAAYVAMATGVGISLSTAEFIRMSLMFGSIALLILVAGRGGRRWWRVRQRSLVHAGK